MEILVSTAIFAVMLSILAMIVNSVQKAWVQGEQKVEIYQNGRAVLELISRELSQAVVSSRIQFVQTLDLSGIVTHLAPNSPSLFWMAPGRSTAKGDLCEIGYYLTRDDANQSYQLNRFLVTPDNSDDFYLGANAYDLETDFDPDPNMNRDKRPYSFANEALWITDPDLDSAFNPTSPKRVVSVAADGVVAFWIRCLDMAGNPIPWLSQNSTYSAEPIQFNSGASFQMTTQDAPFDNGGTFVYGAGPTTTTAVTKAANRLPGSVEITMILVDTRSLARNPVIPSMPALTNEKDIPGQIQTFQEDLVKAGISSARTFTTKVRCKNALF